MRESVIREQATLFIVGGMCIRRVGETKEIRNGEDMVRGVAQHRRGHFAAFPPRFLHAACSQSLPFCTLLISSLLVQIHACVLALPEHTVALLA